MGAKTRPPDPTVRAVSDNGRHSDTEVVSLVEAVDTPSILEFESLLASELMAAPKAEYNDFEILELVASVEKRERPFKHSVSGVEYDDLVDDFEYEDFDMHPTIMIPNRLKYLSESGYLEQVYPGGSSANAAYRLSEAGWETVDASRPDELE